jgi:hypothetical protein
MASEDSRSRAPGSLSAPVEASQNPGSEPALELGPFLLIVRTGRIVTHVLREYRRILGVSSI